MINLLKRLTDIRTINADLEAAGELPLDAPSLTRTAGIPLETLREMEGLTNNLRKTKSNMEAAYIELRKEEGDIGVIKDELERERALDEPDRNKLKSLEEEVKEREKSYFANQRRYRDLNIGFKNQAERIRAILASEKPLGDRHRELFKKEGIIIASITTAIGLIITIVALAISNLVKTGPGPPSSPRPKPSGRGFVDNDKSALKKVASYLRSLASKAAASIPGLIGSVISCLFKAASQIVETLANNDIFLIIALIGLLFAVLQRQIRRGTKNSRSL